MKKMNPILQSGLLIMIIGLMVSTPWMYWTDGKKWPSCEILRDVALSLFVTGALAEVARSKLRL